MSTQRTAAPSRASASAIARPMLEAEPVTSARSPLKRPMGVMTFASRFRMLASTGRKYPRNRAGSSLMGKWPRPSMMVASAPSMRRASSRVIVGRAGVVVLARQQVERAFGGVDLGHAAAHVAVGGVEVQVAFEHAGAALHVVPDRLPAVGLGRRRGDEPRDHAAAHLAAVHVRAVQPVEVVIGLGMRAGLQPDQGAETRGMLQRQVQHDAPADGAAHRHRLVERERIDHGHDGVDVGARCQLVLGLVPARRRRGLAVPGQVEGDDAELGKRLGVVEEAAVLPAVGARRVQAQQRDAGAGLLDIEPVRLALDVEAQIAADGGLERGFAHRLRPARGGARQRQQLLEIEQVGEEGMLVAFELQRPRLDHGHQVMEARRRHRLPERRPGVLRGPEREGPARHDEGPLVDGLDAAAVDAHEIGDIPHLQQERDVEIAAAVDEPGLVVGQRAQPFDEAGARSLPVGIDHRSRTSDGAGRLAQPHKAY